MTALVTTSSSNTRTSTGVGFDGLLLFLYLVLITCAGTISPGIMWADLLLPAASIRALILARQIDRWIIVLAAMLLFYSLVIGIFSVAFAYNGIFFALALTARSAAFVCLLLLFASSPSRLMLPLIVAAACSLLGVAIISTINVYNDTKAYYGFVQIPSTWAPGTSGFVLSVFAIALNSIRRSLVDLPQQQSRWLLVLSVMFSFLGIFTFSITAIIVLSAYWMFVAVWGIANNKGSQLLFTLISIAGALLFMAVSWGNITSIFWRLDWFWYKLTYRFDKIDAASRNLCSDVSCFIFGIGPGSHSYHNGSELGETSILSFDSLHGRILLEWGVVGSLLWILLLFGVSAGLGNIRNVWILLFITLSVLLGFGFEYFFEAYSGSLFAILFGLVLRASRQRVVRVR